ncbi:flavodoxin [Thermotoga sp.]|uniref:flavodoxin n=1 Tax=Thermotoga sp. TaxID=28240 RepID=UPI0025EAECBE|nr:flavodoxin [Thermotoga sp.]MCD6552071.1 flavodoxin [Thermotoga sp.]
MKPLIVFYSWSGNARKIAMLIQELTGGDIAELIPENSYPASYRETVEQAKREIRTGYKPPLKTNIESLERYDLIFLGTPNWWGTIAPPVATFLSQYSLSGKKIAPFISHGGGGRQRIVEDIKKMCPNSNVLKELVVYCDGGKDLKETVSRWIEEVLESN